MRRNRISSFAFVTCFVASAVSYGEEFRGRITKVDSAKKEIVVEGRGSARGLGLGFAVTGDTKILFGREPAKFEDLQPGDRVRLHYENRNNQRVALSITDLSLLPRLPAGGNAPPERVPAPAEKSGGGKTSTPPMLPANTIAGRLARVGLTEKEIVIIGPGAQGTKETETTLLIPGDVKVTKDQKPLKLEELKEGEQVTIRTEKRDGHLVAAEIQTGGTTSAAMPPPAPPSNLRIEKIRQALKIADWFLQQMEEQQKEAPK
jgi:hypothetical protein